MKVNYRGCEIEVFRERGLEEFTNFSVVDTKTGFEVTSGFTEGNDKIQDCIEYMKEIVDDYREHPEDYE